MSKDPSSKNTIDQIKEKTHTFIKSTTVHGLTRIGKTDKLLVKLIWTVILLGSVSFGMTYIVRTIKDYYQYDVITNIERVEPKEVTFPAVTVCQSAYYDKFYYNGTFTKSKTFLGNRLKDFIRVVSSPTKNWNRSGLEFFNLPRQIKDCVRFNGFNGFNGTAETVNSTEQVFTLIMRASISVKNETSDEYIVYQPSFAGYYVYIEDNHLKSYLKTVPLYIDWNYYYYLTFEKNEIYSRLGEPYNECDETLDVTYRHMNCIEECINEEIKLKYNCSIPSFYTVRGLKTCLSDLSLNQTVVDLHANKFKVQNLIDEFRTGCDMECPRECYATKHRLQVSNKYSLGGQTRLDFSFSDLTSLKITQIPKMNWFSVISGVGGLLGLFIGVSFLSLVEILELLVDIFVVVCVNH